MCHLWCLYDKHEERRERGEERERRGEEERRGERGEVRRRREELIPVEGGSVGSVG